ncbi:MAG: arylformamidase, partial [Caulobacteraceae bacterium]|nr:arylformamidase [Caulobacteraceae bacterium]
WDISQTIRPGLPVWPGDTAFQSAPTWTMGGGSPVNVARVSLSTHSGTHADAPLHYWIDGPGAGEVDLEPYLGPCMVVDARGCGSLVEPRHVPREALGEARVLLRTFETFPHDVWRSDFAAVAPETIRALAAAGGRLIGVDSPSLDPEDSKTMDAHQAVAAADMRVLEGLVLNEVPAGRYELIALPLPLAGADASPVRAILRALA